MYCKYKTNIDKCTKIEYKCFEYSFERLRHVKREHYHCYYYSYDDGGLQQDFESVS